MTECIWCEKGKSLEKIVWKVADLPSGTVYLHRDQTHHGRCIFAYGRHVQKLSDLRHDEYMSLMEDIGRIVHAINDVYLPDKINILVLGDEAPHMHIHICPKYKDGVQWGVPFLVNEKIIKELSDKEMEDQSELIKRRLSSWVKY